MTTRMKSVFFAYAAEPKDIGFSVEAACKVASSPANRVSIKPWSAMDIFGASIPDKVRAAIEDADALLCDITVPNLNVYYEIGYAIGIGKPVGPFVNVAHNGAEKISTRTAYATTSYLNATKTRSSSRRHSFSCLI